MDDQAEPEWWQTLFDEKYLSTYIDRLTPEQTTKEVDFIVSTLDLEKGAKILDLACGHGRHSLELAKRGYRVTGVDYSEHFINIAKENAKKENVNVTYTQGDMREISYKDEFDAVVNIFTSFGYFKDDSDNVKVFKKNL